MSENVTRVEKTQKNESFGKYGISLAVLGMVLVLLDGIVVLSINSVLAPSYGGPAVVGWSQIVLSLIGLGVLYFYKGYPVAVAWTVAILAVITYAFDGGFYYIGATLALAGAILIAYRK
ncbi:MAG: hypothetical protein QW812_04375 [Thermoplasmataceae archaeon]